MIPSGFQIFSIPDITKRSAAWTDLNAPQVGLEPTTLRLTAECSAIELLRNMESGSDLLSRAVSSQVPSALKGLTSVFGMGTGGSPSSSPPEMVSFFCGSRLLAPDRYPVTEQSSFSSSVQSLELRFPRSPRVSALFLSPHPDNCTASKDSSLTFLIDLILA